jgi:hypothetical protein
MHRPNYRFAYTQRRTGLGKAKHYTFSSSVLNLNSYCFEVENNDWYPSLSTFGLPRVILTLRRGSCCLLCTCVGQPLRLCLHRPGTKHWTLHDTVSQITLTHCLNTVCYANLSHTSTTRALYSAGNRFEMRKAPAIVAEFFCDFPQARQPNERITTLKPAHFYLYLF